MEKLTFYAVGDIGIHRPKPETALVHVADKMKEADLSFCQLERALSERGEKPDAERAHSRVSPDMAKAITYAGFKVVSFASNHTGDWGTDAVVDTLDVLKKNKLAVIGAGRNIAEARKPVIIEKKGVKIGFLGYCSVPRPGYEATDDRPGLAPVRAWSIYQPREYQPGTPGVNIYTFPDPDDIEAMEEDIRSLRPQVDVLMMSIHWGIHFQRASIAKYQRRVGHAAINAGVDLILGHHAHILKGMEVYKGKVIVYSMCNFCMDNSSYANVAHKYNTQPKTREMMDGCNWKLDPKYPGYAFPIDSRKSLVVKAVIEDKKISRVSFLPLWINKNAEPEMPARDDKRFNEVVKYMRAITAEADLNAKYRVNGSEVVIKG